jgi:hypothetical protein
VFLVAHLKRLPGVKTATSMRSCSRARCSVRRRRVAPVWSTAAQSSLDRRSCRENLLERGPVNYNS